MSVAFAVLAPCRGSPLSKSRPIFASNPAVSPLPHFSQLKKFVSNQQGGRSMSETSTLIGYGGRTIGREELTLVPTPAATETHRPIPHHEIVQAPIETLCFRPIGGVPHE